MTRLALIAPLAAIALAGCHTKPTPTSPDIDPDLRRIASAYAKTVASLHARPGETWRHDWHGNIWPNVLGDTFGQKGLCYQWQEEVWLGIQPALRATGWQGVGIAANTGHWTEHHVVAVFDPARLSASDLLHRAPPRPAWVLDPWHTGRAEVYTLDEWLTNGAAEWYSVALEAMPTPPPSPLDASMPHAPMPSSHSTPPPNEPATPRKR